MKRLFKAFRAIGFLVKDPWKLNRVINENDEWLRTVEKKHGCSALPIIPLPFFLKNSISVNPYSFLEGGASPADLALLRALAESIPHCRYFEIGTWRGESVANVAAVAEECYTLNLPDNLIFQQFPSDDYIRSHRFFSEGLPRVIHLTGDSFTYPFESLLHAFDLIFIDGDHHYDAVYNDTCRVLKHLCHESTIVVWHDYASTPESVRCETLAAILDACPPELHRHLYHVQNTLCAILYRKEAPTVPFRRFALPEYFFNVQITVSSTGQKS